MVSSLSSGQFLPFGVNDRGQTIDGYLKVMLPQFAGGAARIR
jgi:hypothetical protein